MHSNIYHTYKAINKPTPIDKAGQYQPNYA